MNERSIFEQKSWMYPCILDAKLKVDCGQSWNIQNSAWYYSCQSYKSRKEIIRQNWIWWSERREFYPRGLDPQSEPLGVRRRGECCFSNFGLDRQYSAKTGLPPAKKIPFFQNSIPAAIRIWNFFQLEFQGRIPLFQFVFFPSREIESGLKFRRCARGHFRISKHEWIVSIKKRFVIFYSSREFFSDWWNIIF